MALPRPSVGVPEGRFSGAAPPGMAALVVNKPGMGLDSGRQGSRGSAVVKVRDLACSVLHHWPPFGLSRRSGCSAAALASFGGMRGRRAPLGFSIFALRTCDFCPRRPEVAGSTHASPLPGIITFGDVLKRSL